MVPLDSGTKAESKQEELELTYGILGRSDQLNHYIILNYLGGVVKSERNMMKCMKVQSIRIY
jgi:hypothetical protein